MPQGSTTHKTIDEKELLLQLRSPRTADRAFENLVRLYQEPLYWHIRKMVKDHDEADDVLQTTFIKAWKNIDKFRGESKLKTWLFRIATNECLTFLNRQKRRSYTELADIQDDLSHSTQSMDTLSGEDIQAKLRAAIDTLPQKQKLVFNMKYFEELKYQEIQAVLGGSVGSLKASFHHAVKKIEVFLKAH